jgi:hypothetical protein
MYGALSIVESNFLQKEQRDYIMKIICGACGDPDTTVQNTGVSCLVRTAELYYQNLEDYLTTIWEVRLPSGYVTILTDSRSHLGC